MRCLSSVLLMSMIVSGCSSKDDHATVAGRTRSLATAYRGAPPALDARLRFARVAEQATGVARATVVASVAAVGSSAILRLPTGEELMLAAAGGRLEATLEGTPAELDARCPDGAYAFTVAQPDGTRPGVTLLVVAAWPPAPTITAPGDLALAPGPTLDVAWSWSGTAALFDVTAADDGGALVFAARDVAGSTLRVGPLAPGRHRLEVRALSASAASAARFEVGAAILVDVTP
jgi:hypothetical protein